MRWYQAPMAVLCMRSMKVSVPVMLRMAPNTDKSARFGSPPAHLETHTSKFGWVETFQI